MNKRFIMKGSGVAYMDTDKSNTNRNFMWAGWVVAVLALVCLILSLSAQFHNIGAQNATAANSPAAIPQVGAQPTESKPWQGSPRISPFQAVRWQDQTAQVLVNGQWYELVAINDIPVEKILEFAKALGPSNWQKHFSEDLVEVLTRMGHQPGSAVALSVKELPSGNAKVLKDVPMTEANREEVMKANAGTGPHD